MVFEGGELVAYILHKAGCIHPFRLSRILALAELEWLRRGRGRLSNLRYVRGPGVFYIEGVKELVESSSCYERVEGDPATGRRGCIKFKCSPPQLPRDVVEVLEGAIRESSKLDDMELNRRVVEDPLFNELAPQP